MSNLTITIEAVQKQWHAEIQIGGLYARNKMVNVKAESYDEAMAAVRDALKVIAPRDFIATYKLGDPAPDAPAINTAADNLAKARAAKAAKRAAAASGEPAAPEVSATIHPIRELPK